MQIEIDLSAVPPAMTLLDSDDFGTLKVVVRPAEHALVAPDELVRLAGARACDPEWRERFDRMIAFAEEHGWSRPDGAIRAHVEHGTPT
jgi:hypothetical protein